MLFSAAMIGTELAGQFSVLDYNGNDATLNLARVLFYVDELTLRSDTMYLFSEDTVVPWAALTMEKGTALILEKKPEGFTAPDGVSVMVLAEAHPPLLRFSNMVQQVVEKYNRYEATLLNLASTANSLQPMVSFATAFFDNEMTIRDADYRYLAKSYPTVRDLELSGMPPLTKDGFLPPEMVTALKRSESYLKENRSAEPAYWYNRDSRHNYIYMDLFDNGRFLYRVKVADVNHPLRSFDAALLKHFVELIRANYYRFSAVPGSSSSRMRLLAEQLLDTGTLTKEQCEDMLSGLKWEKNALYVCVCIQLCAQDETMDNFAWYCSLLTREFEDTFALYYKKRIMLLAKLDGVYEGDPENFLRRLAFFVRENNLRAGVSRRFQDILQLGIYYRQAHFALELGTENAGFIWVHRFSEHLYDYLRSVFKRDFGALSECFKGLPELLRSDGEKGGDLVQTVKCYLDNDRNLSQTAAKLFIHRGTLTYRLEKAEKILGFPLSDREQALLLQLGLRLLEDVEEKS